MGSGRRERLVTLATRLVAYGRASFIGSCATRMMEIGSRDRAVTIAGQAFIALIPLMILIAGWTDRTGDGGFGETLITYFKLSGSSAEAVRSLFEAPPSATGGTSLIGLVILLISIGSFSRALQRLYESAWRLPRKGMRGTMSGLAGLGTLIAVLFGHAWLVHVLGPSPIPRAASLAIETATIFPLWALFMWLMVSRRIEYRVLLVSAAICAAGQVGLSWWTRLYVPHLIATDADRYGVIGVAFALVSWLVLVAYLLVGSAVVGVELTDRMRRADPPLVDRLLALSRRGETATRRPPRRQSDETPRSQRPRS